MPAIGAGLVVGQHAAGGIDRQGRAFGHAVGVWRGGRHIVNDGHYHRVADRIAVLVDAGVGEGVGLRHAGHVGGRAGQHIAELAIGANAPVAQRRAAALPNAHAPAAGQRQVARGGMAHARIGACRQAAFVDRSTGGAGWHAGDVGHVDSQRGGRSVAIGVGDGIAEDVLHIGSGRVRPGDIAVAAIGLERQGAVLAGDGCAYASGHGRAAAGDRAGHAAASFPAIGAGLVVGQHAAGGSHRQGRALGHIAGVRRGGWHIVDDLDGQRTGVGHAAGIGNPQADVGRGGVVAICGRVALLLRQRIAVVDAARHRYCMAGSGIESADHDCAVRQDDAQMRAAVQRIDGLQLSQGI